MSRRKDEGTLASSAELMFAGFLPRPLLSLSFCIIPPSCGGRGEKSLKGRCSLPRFGRKKVLLTLWLHHLSQKHALKLTALFLLSVPCLGAVHCLSLACLARFANNLLLKTYMSLDKNQRAYDILWTHAHVFLKCTKTPSLSPLSAAKDWSMLRSRVVREQERGDYIMKALQRRVLFSSSHFPQGDFQALKWWSEEIISHSTSVTGVLGSLCVCVCIRHLCYTYIPLLCNIWNIAILIY